MQKIYSTNFDKVSAEDIEALKSQYRQDPMSLLDVQKSDADYITSRITSFLRDYLAKSNTKGYVIGLSGGIDSAVSATLAVKAIGSENVYGMMLPSKFTAQSHIDDAKQVAMQLGIWCNDYELVQRHFDDSIELTMEMTGINKDHPNYNLLLGNNHARERMKILRGRAASMNYLVLGTTNLTEAWLGYATIAGDGYKGIDVEPIQRLPKTSERIYSKFIGIPEQVITKAPTAGLWEGQTDEGEIGMTYEDIDRVMAGHMLGMTIDDIITSNNRPAINRQSIGQIVLRARRNEFKSMPEPYADLSFYGG